MTNDLDAFWLDAEERQSLSPAIVDYYLDLGDMDFGAFLMWAWRADRWPSSIKTWAFWENDLFSIWECWTCYIGRPFRFHLVDSLYTQNNSSNGQWTYRFPTARAAFEFLYAAWQKLTFDEMRALMEATG